MICTTRLCFWADACTISPSLILINPRCAGDAGLVAHEQVHVTQMARVGTVMFWWRYLSDPAFRLSAEVDAYREQARYYPDDRLPLFAGFIATRYRLNIPAQVALSMLQGF
jgi:hypothetical protein